jgi:HD superfamily phosphodiesterase
MENSLKNISTAEAKWQKLLFNYSKEKFTLIPLPSHDQLHHLRVWKFAKEILSELDKYGNQYSFMEVEAILIAVFFHDLGMTVTREKDHGAESRDLCLQFFEAHKVLRPSNLQVILEMIEKHDDKEYINHSETIGRPSTAVILNIADDLDAFGYIGIYRYTEIYHFRGISVQNLPSCILPNLEARFQHFTRHLGKSGNLAELHGKRFFSTRTFFINLEEDLKLGNNNPGSFQKIIQNLIEFSNSNETKVHSLAHYIHDTDPVVKNFFKKFIDELKEDTFD